MITNSLKYPPIKQQVKNLPKQLIYAYSQNSYNNIKVFRMFNTSNPKEIARMECLKSTTDRDGLTDVPSLYIFYLIAKPRGKGLGTAFLDFAKKYSKNIGCNGNINLYASRLYEDLPSPHVFYKKNGLESRSYFLNKTLDFLAKYKFLAKFINFKGQDMLYPADKETLSHKIKRFFNE